MPKKITVQELDDMLRKLNVEIRKVIRSIDYSEYEDWSCIKDLEQIDEPDKLQLLDEYRSVMDKLCDINSVMEYYKREVIREGVLSLNANGYYEDDYHEYHCGNGIEFCFYDDWDEKWKWRTSRVEHNGERYYIVGNPKVELNGLRVRYRKS